MFARAAAEPPWRNLAASVLISPGRNNRPALRRNGRFSGSSGGKRRPEPHGHKSFRPSFSTSSVSTPTIRLPRLTRDSLEGTPGGACQTAQKDVSVSWSRYMIVLLVTQSRRIVACEVQVPRAVFHRSGHPVTVALPAAMSVRWQLWATGFSRRVTSDVTRSALEVTNLIDSGTANAVGPLGRRSHPSGARPPADHHPDGAGPESLVVVPRPVGTAWRERRRQPPARGRDHRWGWMPRTMQISRTPPSIWADPSATKPCLR
jgi:hypothetical protein